VKEPRLQNLDLVQILPEPQIGVQLAVRINLGVTGEATTTVKKSEDSDLPAQELMVLGVDIWFSRQAGEADMAVYVTGIKLCPRDSK
jgi:hypothetical protein